jgi:hypothetical protein
MRQLFDREILFAGMISVSPFTHARKVAGLPLIHAHGHLIIVAEPEWVRLLPRLWQLLALI